MIFGSTLIAIALASLSTAIPSAMFMHERQLTDGLPVILCINASSLSLIPGLDQLDGFIPVQCSLNQTCTPLDQVYDISNIGDLLGTGDLSGLASLSSIIGAIPVGVSARYSLSTYIKT